MIIYLLKKFLRLEDDMCLVIVLSIKIMIVIWDFFYKKKKSDMIDFVKKYLLSHASTPVAKKQIFPPDAMLSILIYQI